MNGIEWWESQMFDYIYHDGNPCQDEDWLREMQYIADIFEESGMEWCLNGQHWKMSKGACYSCDF
jgi:hypothetical protein